MATNPIRLAIVNDYEVVVLGLAHMLERYHDRIEIVELDADTPLARPVDIALYDTFAQPQGGEADMLQLIDGLKADKTVVYTWNFEPGLAERTIARGANGYLAKSLSASALVQALEQVHSGNVVVSPAGGRSTGVSGDWPGREEGLTQRESEVLALITQGLSNEQIVKRTYLSINSVKSYIRSTYRKIGATSRAQAVLWGVEHGFLPSRKRLAGPD